MSFGEFARFICAFPNLLKLKLVTISCKRREAYCLATVGFARSLGLCSLDIDDERLDSNLSLYWQLLTAPRLSITLTNICLDVAECVLEDLAPGQQYHPLTHLTHLQKLEIVLAVQEDIQTLNPALAILLSQMPPVCITTVKITYWCHVRRTPLFGLSASSSLYTLRMLDEALASPSFSSLTTVHITFLQLYPRDALYLRANEHLLFRLLRTRRILDLVTTWSDGDGVHRDTIVRLGFKGRGGEDNLSAPSSIEKEDVLM
ncbi:hypothetical protein OBBRIDRAFT_837890 [Obba rivulosa]|uniref:Uncharacterized protein n=1 Tax=Obba rivulosa TaxID=1052685 RepID=A0A8E2ALF3_9APHY|nr:hypothetical protein OBBRIDRAFT_837890 [Obba rivulosa]